MTTADGSPPDNGIEADVHIQRFNEAFYRSNPADYIETRLQLLLVVGGRRTELRDLVRGGVEFAGLALPASDEQLDEEAVAANDRDLDRFLVVDSQHLLHHACETALRLFAIHANGWTVPWIGLARGRNFAKFKNDVRSYFIDGTPEDRVVASVCLGRVERPEETSEDDWQGSIGSLVAFMREFATRFLDDANLYNSIKHGLGVSASDAVLAIENRVVGSGPSIEYPESADWDGDTREWSLTTQWVDFQYSLGLVQVAVYMIRAMWDIGRYRCLGRDEDSTGRIAMLAPGFRPNDLRSSTRPPMNRMSWRIAKEERNTNSQD